MLAKDEFDLRVVQTFESRTYAELAVVTADIPAGLATAEPPAPTPPVGEQPVARPGAVTAAATAAYAGAWAFVLLVLSPQGSDNPAAPWLIFLGGLTYLGVLLICAGQMIALRREKSSGERPPRRRTPGAASLASQRSPSADQSRQRRVTSTVTSTGRKLRQDVFPPGIAGSRSPWPGRPHGSDRLRKLVNASVCIGMGSERRLGGLTW
jgi:hypothetical protein